MASTASNSANMDVPISEIDSEYYLSDASEETISVNMDVPISEIDFEYLSDASVETIAANMDVPVSIIDIEYLIDAFEKTYFEDDIPRFIPFILYKVAQETRERFKNYLTSFQYFEDSIDLRLKIITDEGKYIPQCPEDYRENESILQVLVQFYSEYNEANEINEIREEDEKHKKWGSLSANFQELEGRSAMRERILTISKALRTALKALSRLQRGDTPEEVFIQENKIPEKFLQDTEYEGSNETYNIIPFDGHTDWLPAEVNEAIVSLKWGFEATPSPTQGRDVLDCLQKFFGFQESSVSNQRENIVNLLSNEQMRLCTPGQHKTAFEDALKNVFLKSFDNYIKWCSYLRIDPIWKNTDVHDISKEKKILYISLYYLIWGEAANVRFLPECLCYIFHHMSIQLDDECFNQMCDQLDGEHVSGSFLDQVIQPLYEVIAAEAKINSKRDAPHSTWRNYDDFNEYFWSPDCLKLGWPLNRDSPFFQKPPEGSTTVFGKTSFVEHRTFWHLYHSFHRMWIFHVMIFQVLAIVAFNDEKLNSSITLREILVVGPTYFLMKLIQSRLDIWLKDGAYSNTNRADVLRIRFRIIRFRAFCLLLTLIIFFVGIFRNCLQEKTSSVEESIAFYACIVVLVFYACTIMWIDQLEKWVVRRMDERLLDSYLEEEYVGRDMGEKYIDIFWYIIFWLVTLGINFAYTYSFLIKYLVATRDITDVSKNIHHMLAIGSLWVGVICAYIVGFHVVYNVTSAVVGSFVGYWDSLGEIKSLGDVHKCFDSVPKAFMDHLHIPPNIGELPPVNNHEDVKLNAEGFSPIWNQIVMHLREEDYISDLEQYALSMPKKSGCIDVIQWPLFLLVGKVSLAIKIAAKNVPQKDMWDEISRDVYTKYAVEECFHSVEFILSSVLDDQGRMWVKDIYRSIRKSIEDRNLDSTFQLKKLENIIKEISEITESLEQESRLPEATETLDQNRRRFETLDQDQKRYEARRELEKKAKNAQRLKTGDKNAATKLYDVIQRDFLREEETKRREFSDFKLPTDHPELRSQIRRLHMLLNMKSADHVPRNREARRRLEFFTNSLFMSMPTTMPVREMLSFSVLTPYYDEVVLYTIPDILENKNGGITLIDYLKNLYPDEWNNYCERLDKRYIDNPDEENLELRLWASYRGQTLARTVRGTMYYQKALLLQAYMKRSGVDELPRTSPVYLMRTSGSDVSMDEDTRATLEKLVKRISRGKRVKKTFDIRLRDKDNYEQWKEKMILFLHKQEMTSFVIGSLRDPADGSIYSKKWKKIDKQVMKWIVSSLDESLHNSVKDIETAEQMWDTLEEVFGVDVTGLSGSDVSIDEDTRARLNSLEERSSRGELLVQTSGIMLHDKENYEKWKTEMTLMLVGEDMESFVDGSLRDPGHRISSKKWDGPLRDPGHRISSKKWKKLDKQVRKWIMSSLDESLHNSVKDSETAEQMWNALEEIIKYQRLNECFDKVNAHVDLKFTYVVTCQNYGKQKINDKEKAADIAFLLKRNEGLRVAFVDEVNNEFYSKLVKADMNGKEKEVYSIKLPGNPKLGEGKPENQNHAIVFTRGNALQTIDMNQDNYFEETLKMRNLLEEFHREPGIPRPTILGIREHIFTGSASSLASFMSNQETGFVTLGQRVIAKPLKVRMHYGHPDVFDRVFHITRGGISKASLGINISEDIYAGFNSTLRQGSVTHHEYIQVGKGRDVGFNQIALFEGKVAGGNGEQVLSRDIYRLGQRFDFFRMLSFYYTTVGYYFSSLLMVITLYILLYGNLFMALSGTRVPHVLNNIDMTPEWFSMIVLLPAIYMLLVPFLEQGLEKAAESFLAMFFSLGSIFYAFSLGTRIHSFGKTVIHGGASYQATGRGFVLHHIKFSENYWRYSRSHFIKGMELLFLVVVYIIYGFHSARAFYNNLLLLGGSILSISWIVAPFLFDSSPFNRNKNSEDWKNWNDWRNYKSVPVEENRPVQEGVPAEEPVPVEEGVLVQEGIPTEEPVPVEESVAGEEHAPVEEIVPVDESVPVDERVPAEEHVPVEERVIVEEHVPVDETVSAKKSVPIDKSWESWWNKELDHIRTPAGRVIETILSLRFFIFPLVVGYKLDVQGLKNSLSNCVIPWICLVGILFAYEFFSFCLKKKLVIQFFSNNRVETIGALTIAIAYYYAFGYMLVFTIAIITIVWGFISGTIGLLVVVCCFSPFGNKLAIIIAIIIAIITTIRGFLSFFLNNRLATIGALAIAYYCSALGDTLALFIAIVTTVWGFLSICVAWKEVISLWTPLMYLAWICDTRRRALSVNINGDDDLGRLLLHFFTYVSYTCKDWKPTLERFNLRRPVRDLAWFCDTGMGALMFKIANIFSQRSIRQYLLRNLFDQNISELLHKSSSAHHANSSTPMPQEGFVPRSGNNLQQAGPSHAPGVMNREKRDIRPGPWQKTPSPLAALPETTVSPKTQAGVVSNRAPHTGEDVSFYNVDPNKVERKNYVDFDKFLNSPITIFLDCHIKGFSCDPKFWKDLLCMGDSDGWLSDDHMNAWTELQIRKRGKDDMWTIAKSTVASYAPKSDNVFLLDTDNQLQGTLSGRTRPYPSWAQVDKVFMPIHVNGNHWVTAVVDRANSTFKVYDSSDSKDRGEILEKQVIAWTTVLNKILDMSEPYNFKYSYNESINGSRIPQQTNGKDCGVITCWLIQQLHSNGSTQLTKVDHSQFFKEFRKTMASDFYDTRCEDTQDCGYD